jgi:nitroreductase
MQKLDNPVLVALRERRSIRAFTGEPVSPELAGAILEAGRWAPSGLNNQPWRFLALFGGDPRQEALAGLTKYAATLGAARLLVVVLLDRSAMYHPLKDHQAAGACIQNMLLAAHALGLGGVWLGEIVNRPAEVLTVLGLSPEDFELMAVLAFGRTAQAGESSRRPLAELLLESLPGREGAS